MNTRIISAALLLFSASVTSAYALVDPELAPAKWVGNSIVKINTNKYYCGSYLSGCNGAFNDADLGELPVLTLGGQSEIYNRPDNDSGNTEYNWKLGSSMDMYYQIDNEAPATIQLIFAGETNGNNMVLKTSNGNEAEINLTPYRDGEYHTLTVWFQSGNVYDNNTYEGVTYNYVANFKAVEPTANWVGKSAINVNGTWYYAGEELYWGGGAGNQEFFHGKNLGPITSLTLGGQSQIYDDGLDWKEGEMNMYYRIDNGVETAIILSYYTFYDNEHNMVFQSGGSNFVDTSIDISELADGEHTLSIWFERNEVYDSNNSNNYVATFTKINNLTISDTSSESEVNTALNEYMDRYVNFVIEGRTIYAGTWNTLCLPFWIEDLRGTILEDADMRKFTGATFEEGTLTLNFQNQPVGMDPQIPYLVKLPEGADDIVNPEFKNVQIVASSPKLYTFDSNQDAVVLFHGCFGSTTISGNQYLYLGAGDMLYWPDPSVNLGAFRGYFELADGITAGEPTSTEPESQGIKAFVLNFGDETTSINQINNATSTTSAWYTLDGRRLNDKPATAGLYINNGKKVVIK